MAVCRKREEKARRSPEGAAARAERAAGGRAREGEGCVSRGLAGSRAVMVTGDRAERGRKVRARLALFAGPKAARRPAGAVEGY